MSTFLRLKTQKTCNTELLISFSKNISWIWSTKKKNLKNIFDNNDLFCVNIFTNTDKFGEIMNNTKFHYF